MREPNEFVIKVQAGHEVGLPSANESLVNAALTRRTQIEAMLDASQISPLAEATRAETEPRLRAIAFLLPQFHPVPENDAFWGNGFTEWRNVVRARPRFRGHVQPHLPADLGFYDMRLPETHAAQAALAASAGLSGFCYYHYWFGGQRILHTPFDTILSSGEPNFPFMLCWANENWTRAWAGGAREVLLAQTYSDADTVAHARHLAPAFHDPRYIRVNGRPAFAIYNTDQLLDPHRWSDLFRATLAEEGLDPYLIRVERYLDRDKRAPDALGFDAALDFQPFSRSFYRWLETRPDLKASPVKRFAHGLRRRSGNMYRHDAHHDLEAFVRFDSAQAAPAYPWHPGVAPSWDNSARRPKGKAIIFRKSDPVLFRKWVAAKSRLASDGGRLLFVNAWNEWAEGNHLEPCLTYGHAWLDALRAGLNSTFARQDDCEQGAFQQ